MNTTTNTRGVSEAMVDVLAPSWRAPDNAVERLAKHIYQKECLFKSLDDALFHMSNWRRAIPEARAMLEAAFPNGPECDQHESNFDALSAPEPAAQEEAVAWQINATMPDRGWENCTQECYEDTLRTGRYMGLPAGATDVKVRELFTRPANSTSAESVPEGLVFPSPKAAEGSAKFLLERFDKRPCDSSGVSCCIRCNAVALSRWVLEALATAPPAQPAERVPEGLQSALREAAEVLQMVADSGVNLPPNWRWPLLDELSGYAYMLMDASSAPSEGGKGVDRG